MPQGSPDNLPEDIVATMLVRRAQKKFDRHLIPSAPNLEFEAPLWNAGLKFIAGIDEAGRGALAGPVAAAAVVFLPDSGLCQALPGVRDSKELSPAEREHWAEQIKSLAISYAIGFASHQEIDELSIVPATRLAARRALELLSQVPQHLLLDFLELPDLAIPQTALVKGDARSLSIASASILAKTARDELMRQLDRQYPGYGFAQHKGYGTLAHRHALARLGMCLVHRRSFKLKT